MLKRTHIMLAALIVLALTVLLGAFPALAQDDANQTATEAEPTAAEIYQRISPSVVSIQVVTAQGAGNGSGFVYDTDGHIITNNHVVADAEDIIVNFRDGTLARARVVGLDPDSDLAVIEADAPPPELDPLSFADSSQLIVGQPVYAIGSPFGQEWTLTSGLIGALNRTISGLEEFSIGGVIQTDAAINPGNSGGPLLDASGNVVGVNSQIISRSGASAGVGFAIPGNLTQRVARALIDQGHVDYSYIGISGTNMSINIIEQFGLDNDQQGILVIEAVQGAPAARAGVMSAEQATGEDGQPILESADILTAVDGEPINNIGGLLFYLATETLPGDTVTATVLRATPDGTEELTFDVTLTPRP
ncbi:MAG: S1C family serine protease [Anaerolineales bacterium]